MRPGSLRVRCTADDATASKASWSFVAKAAQQNWRQYPRTRLLNTAPSLASTMPPRGYNHQGDTTTKEIKGGSHQGDTTTKEGESPNWHSRDRVVSSTDDHLLDNNHAHPNRRHLVQPILLHEPHDLNVGEFRSMCHDILVDCLLHL